MIINRNECRCLRGLAITSIILHNFCHWVPLSPAENEFIWNESRTRYFISVLGDSFFVNFFSFWGHYGVIVFVFITGFGLAVKYENSPNESSTCFVIYHYKKLVKLLIPGFVLFLLTYFILYSALPDEINFFQITAQLALMINLFPFTIIHSCPGPYWYFGLTMQFYLIYRVFLYKKKMYCSILLVMLVLGVTSMLFSKDHIIALNWIKNNSIGYIIPFSLGFFIGKKNNNYLREGSIPRLYFFLSVLFCIPFLFLFELSYFTWIMMPPLILIVSLSMVKCFNNTMFEETFSYIGDISSLIFIVHPTVRAFFYYYAESTFNPNYIVIVVLYVFATLLLSQILKPLFVLKK